MAKVDFTGLADFEARLKRREKAATEAVPAMLAAGAEVLVKAEQDEIERHDLIDKHALIDSIKPTKIKTVGSESSVEVYPQGKDKKGARNATKGFVHEYGSSSIEAKPWHSTAVEKSTEAVREAMNKKWEQITSESRQNCRWRWPRPYCMVTMAWTKRPANLSAAP